MTRNYPLVSANFWGKIFGTKANYIIAETEFQEGEGEEEENDTGKESLADKIDSAAEGDEDENASDADRDEPPSSQWKAPPVIPKEESKTGTNKKTYFVCNTRKFTMNKVTTKNLYLPRLISQTDRWMGHILSCAKL